MRERPFGLGDDTLAACLQTEYGLPITDLTFLPLGHDAAGWVYRATTTDGAAYFVKVKTAISNEAALIVPHYLVAHGVRRVVAPLSSRRGPLSGTTGRYGVIVYPYISEKTGLLHGMSDGQWAEYGATLRQIHDVALSAELRNLLRAETFVPDGAASLARLGGVVPGGTFEDPGQESTARFWQDRAATIASVAERAEALGRQLTGLALPLVLCHADIHTNNVLVDGPQHIAIVDWDETMLAPRERDLMFVVGGIGPGFVTAQQERLFFTGYGAIDMDAVALAYYRFAWAVSDIAAYAEQIFDRPYLGARDHEEAVERFRSLFDEGSIVDIAFSSPI